MRRTILLPPTCQEMLSQSCTTLAEPSCAAPFFWFRHIVHQRAEEPVVRQANGMG